MTEELKWNVGVDWGSENHQVCVLDAERRVVSERAYRHSGEGLAELARDLLSRCDGHPERVAVGIETPRGPVVELLVDRGFRVYAINPKQLDRLRDRHTVAGAKDDRRDAFVLADSLRSDLHLFRPVQQGDPLVVQLLALSRDDEQLTVDHGRLSNRLREQLLRYHPSLLTLCPAADEPWLWALLEKAATPAQGARLGDGTIRSILREGRIRRLTTADVRDALRAPAVYVAPGVLEAATSSIELLLPQLRALQEQRGRCGERLDAILQRLQGPAPADGSEGSDEGQKHEHRDAEILLSVPGIGKKVAATMLAEAWQPLAERNYHALRAQCGVAPVTRATGKQSGKRAKVSMRRARNPRLSQAAFFMARAAVRWNPDLKRDYELRRQRGQTFGCALRGIADRMLCRLIAMLRTRTLYDPQRLGPRHGRDQESMEAA